ncbi:hypothetical protein CRYUN_Cryun38cG0009000 [Craigia yunnanensis]
MNFKIISSREDEEEYPTHGSVLGGKPNRCVIYPPKSNIVAESMERRNKDWIVRTKFASDLIVQFGDFNSLTQGEQENYSFC